MNDRQDITVMQNLIFASGMSGWEEAVWRLLISIGESRQTQAGHHISWLVSTPSKKAFDAAHSAALLPPPNHPKGDIFGPV